MKGKEILGKKQCPRRNSNPPNPHCQHITATPSPTHQSRSFFHPLPLPLGHSSRPPQTHLHPPPPLRPQSQQQKERFRASKWQKNRAVPTRTFVLPGDSQENPWAVRKRRTHGTWAEILLLQTYMVGEPLIGFIFLFN